MLAAAAAADDDWCCSSDYSPPRRAGGTRRRVGEGDDDDGGGRAERFVDDSIPAGDGGDERLVHNRGGYGAREGDSQRWRADGASDRWGYPPDYSDGPMERRRGRQRTAYQPRGEEGWPPEECQRGGEGGGASASPPPRTGGLPMRACLGGAALFGAVLLLAVAAPVHMPQATERVSAVRGWQQQQHRQQPQPPPPQPQFHHPATPDVAGAAGGMHHYHHHPAAAALAAMERRNLQMTDSEVPLMTDGGQSERLRRDLLSDYDRGSYPWEYAWMQSGWRVPPSDGDNATTTVADGGDATAATVNNTDVLREGLIVNVGINFHRIYAVDVVSSEADLIVWFRQSWVDPRLSWNPDDYGGLETIWFYVGDGVGAGETSEIWTPDMQLWNMGLSLQASLTDAYANVNSDGLVWWSRPGHLRPVCKFRGLDDFPFDTLGCTMEIGSWAYSGLYLRPTKMAGTGYSVGGSETAGAAFAEFSLRGVTCREHVYPPYPALPEEDWPVLLYEVTFSRSWQPYTRGYLTLQIVLNLAGFACFWMPVQSGERVALAITALLAAVASELVVAARIPSAAELTWFQIFSIVSLAFASVCLFESVAVVYFFYYTHDDLVPDWWKWVMAKVKGCTPGERLNKRVSAASRRMGGSGGGGGSRYLGELAEAQGSGESESSLRGDGGVAGQNGHGSQDPRPSPRGPPSGASGSDSDDFHPNLLKNGSSGSGNVKANTAAAAASAAAEDDVATVNGDVPTAVGIENHSPPPQAHSHFPPAGEERSPPRRAMPPKPTFRDRDDAATVNGEEGRPPPPRRAMPPRSTFRDPAIGTNASTWNLNCSELTMNPVQRRQSLGASGNSLQRRGGIMRSRSVARDADDFHDQKQATNNRYWQRIAARIDEVARATVPLAYAIAIGILVSRIR